jgi:hypothetical protein
MSLYKEEKRYRDRQMRRMPCDGGDGDWNDVFTSQGMPRIVTSKGKKKARSRIFLRASRRNETY